MIYYIINRYVQDVPKKVHQYIALFRTLESRNVRKIQFYQLGGIFYYLRYR